MATVEEPVYFVSANRFFKNTIHFGVARGVLGLVIQERHSVLPEFANRDLDYKVHQCLTENSSFETLDMLPPAGDKRATRRAGCHRHRKMTDNGIHKTSLRSKAPTTASAANGSCCHHSKLGHSISAFGQKQT